MPGEGMAAVNTYTVHAKRWAHGWELHIDSVGVTQSRTLYGADTMVRDYIALETGAPRESFDVQIVPDVAEGVEEKTRIAREAIAAAERAQLAAAAKHRDLARMLKERGLTGRDIATVLRISPQ